MSMETKRGELAALVLSTLQGFDSKYKVDTRLRSVMLRGSSRGERIKLMHDPARYAVVYHNGRDYVTDSGTVDIGGRPKDTTDMFDIQIWHGYKDHAQFDHSSQKEFDDLLSGATTGLLDVLASTEWLTDAAAALGLPQDIFIDLVPLTNSNKELAHYASFTISVT